MPTTRNPLPAGLRMAAVRFEGWRRNRTKRVVPAELWRLAVELAGRHGLNATARALRLDYYSLKSRLGRPGSATVPKSAFVELVAPAPAVARECLVEIENGAGGKMRVHLKGDGVAEVATLERVFLGLSG